jgi:hypothetical protein
LLARERNAAIISCASVADCLIEPNRIAELPGGPAVAARRREGLQFESIVWRGTEVLPGQPATPAIGTRKAAFATGVAQAIAGVLLWHFGTGRATGVARMVTGTAAGVLWLRASAFLVSALVAPAIAARLQARWMHVARAIGIATTFVIFTVLFALVLPLFLFVRLQDPLRKRTGAGSYWETRKADEDSLDRALRPY